MCPYLVHSENLAMTCIADFYLYLPWQGTALQTEIE